MSTPSTLSLLSTLTYATFTTPIGPFTVLADDHEVVHAAGFTDDPAFLVGMLPDQGSGAAPPPPSSTGHRPIADRVAAYFDGDLTALDDVAVAYRATGPFRTAAWAAMRQVRAGTTVSYTDLATTAGNPHAIRAAGSACATNPIALFVPCHRVVRSDGSSKGFLYGLECKANLLAHEKAHAEA
jgi:methylated-DNA-[protein]-cysteine S-methyltransferase